MTAVKVVCVASVHCCSFAVASVCLLVVSVVHIEIFKD